MQFNDLSGDEKQQSRQSYIPLGRNPAVSRFRQGGGDHVRDPSFFLVNSRSLNINLRFSLFSADEDLERGNIYIMFPMRRLTSMVTPADMAAFWMAGNNAGKRISGRISPEKSQVSVCGGGVTVAEELRLVVEVPEFSYRMAVCRSRKAAKKRRQFRIRVSLIFVSRSFSRIACCRRCICQKNSFSGDDVVSYRQKVWFVKMQRLAD